MKSILLTNWEDLTTGKPAKKLIQAFTRAGSNVISATSDGKAKRSSGVSYKTLDLTFADNQQITLSVKQSGDIFQVKLNGAVVPIKNPDDHIEAVKELSAKLDAGRAKFQAKLARTKADLPKGIKSTVTKQADALAARVKELDDQIAEATAKRDALKSGVSATGYDAALDAASLTNTEQKLLDYYKSINMDGKALSYQWGALAKAIGMTEDQAAEKAYDLNSSLVKKGYLKRKSHNDGMSSEDLLLTEQAFDSAVKKYSDCTMDELNALAKKGDKQAMDWIAQNLYNKKAREEGLKYSTDMAKDGAVLDSAALDAALTVEPGTVVHVNGLPFEATAGTVVEGLEENMELAQSLEEERVSADQGSLFDECDDDEALDSANPDMKKPAVAEVINDFAKHGVLALYGGKKGDGFWLYKGTKEQAKRLIDGDVSVISEMKGKSIQNDGIAGGNTSFWKTKDAKEFLSRLPGALNDVALDNCDDDSTLDSAESYAAALKKADGTVLYYTGKAGSEYTSENIKDAFFGYTKEGARRKAEMIFRNAPNGIPCPVDAKGKLYPYPGTSALDSIDPEMFTPGQRDVLRALAEGKTDDGDMPSKTSRDELVEMGLIDRYQGDIANCLTEHGKEVVAALDSAVLDAAKSKGSFAAFNVDSAVGKLIVIVKTESGMSDVDAIRDARSAVMSELGGGATRVIPGMKSMKAVPEDAWEIKDAKGWAWIKKGSFPVLDDAALDSAGFRSGMLQVKMNGDWAYVFSNNEGAIKTTEDPKKALDGDALGYFQKKFANHEFRVVSKSGKVLDDAALDSALSVNAIEYVKRDLFKGKKLDAACKAFVKKFGGQDNAVFLGSTKDITAQSVADAVIADIASDTAKLAKSGNIIPERVKSSVAADAQKFNIPADVIAEAVVKLAPELKEILAEEYTNLDSVTLDDAALDSAGDIKVSRIPAKSVTKGMKIVSLGRWGGSLRVREVVSARKSDDGSIRIEVANGVSDEDRITYYKPDDVVQVAAESVMDSLVSASVSKDYGAPKKLEKAPSKQAMKKMLIEHAAKHGSGELSFEDDGDWTIPGSIYSISGVNGNDDRYFLEMDKDEKVIRLGIRKGTFGRTTAWGTVATFDSAEDEYAMDSVFINPMRSNEAVLDNVEGELTGNDRKLLKELGVSAKRIKATELKKGMTLIRSGEKLPRNVLAEVSAIEDDGDYIKAKSGGFTAINVAKDRYVNVVA